ncbi:helix-turn-helix domain-containing protein [Shouchella lonarensis]|uniref:Transcriptional regulator, AlpA family n=1 Tax=Shouchella lonarensis TaxID=1464122 RepID=A0A1G6IGU2_9BACI|nr:helix-turn-helix domain-containing protein [Shouchella lonarensis]SDC05772.1 transcriptional regulator, AlpA family [Shouchella lonarensis]
MQKITLTVKEVAELLGVSTATIYTLVREGQIPHSRIRAKIIFHKESVEAWVKQGIAI